MKIKTTLGMSGLIALPTASLLIFGSQFMIAQANSQQVVPAYTKSELEQNIGEIITPEGTFLRANVPVSSLNLPKSAVAQPGDDVAHGTSFQAIVRPYGVFVLAGTQVAANLFGVDQSAVNAQDTVNGQPYVDKNAALTEIKKFQVHWQETHH